VARRSPAPRLETLEERSVPTAGALDPTFNGGSLLSVGGVSSAQAVAVQPDSKIVVAGSAFTFTENPTDPLHPIEHSHLAVARLNPDGSLDTSFGPDGTGVVQPPFPGDSGAARVALDPTSGAIVVAGNIGAGPSWQEVLVRLTAAGLPDGSFQSSDGLGPGEQVVPGLGPSLGLPAIAVDPHSGAVVLAGTVSTPAGAYTDSDMAVLRLTRAGAPDPAFPGSPGMPPSVRALDFPLGGLFCDAGASAVAVDCDGSIVVAGAAIKYLADPPGPGGALDYKDWSSYFAVARLTSSGAPDAAFGGNAGLDAGREVLAFNGLARAYAVAIDPVSHAIVVAGQAGEQAPRSGIPNFLMAVARLSPAGALDTAFQGSPGLAPGEQTVNFQAWPGGGGIATANAAAVQTNGSVVLAGDVEGGLAVARLTPAGALDPTFAGGAGAERLGADTAHAVSLDPNTGAIVLAAGKVARLIGDPPVPVPPCNGGGGGGGPAAPPAAPPAGPPAAAVGAFDPATGTWYLRSAAGAGAPDAGQFAYGGAGCLPVVGDWGGRGADGVGVFDPATATWYLRYELSAGAPDAGQFAYGGAGWVSVVGDWDHSGRAGVGAFDPATATWYLRNEASAGAPDAGVFQFGVAGVPVVGDWTGTGHLGIGVFDPTTFTWYLRSSATPGPADVGVFQYGGIGWRPVAGDWTGAGHAGIGGFDPSTGTWYFRSEPSAGAPDAGQFQYGGTDWLPVEGLFPPAVQLLQAAAGEGPGGADPLSAGQLQSAVAGALARLSAAGVDPGLIQVLGSATYGVAQLPPGVLGETDAATRQVLISADAAGHGWFVDGTPLADEEFAPGAPGSPLVALPGAPAAGKADLLSAALHEMGHLAGSPDGGVGLMAGTLGLGTRDLGALDQVFAAPGALAL
jgi:uncharacterized delta-60 repeat protein